MSIAIVLLSGGQDSTTCLYWAKQRFDRLFALSLYYGQRHDSELAAARVIAEMAGAEHWSFDVAAFGQLGLSALTDPNAALTVDGGLVDAEAPSGLPSSFVPGRNAIFLTMAAAFAVSHGARDLVTGTCQTDYSGYPDCRRAFIDAEEHALTLAMPSSCGPIRILTPLMTMTKAESVRLARSLPGCWEALRWSVTCYNGKRPGCGSCPACVLRARGFAEADEVDPAGQP